MRLVAGLSILLGALACSNPAGAPPGSGKPDAGAGDAGSSGQAAQEPSCTKPAKAGEAFAVDPAHQTEIPGRVAFDGTLWLSYSHAADDGSADFDVALTRLGCDGTVAMSPETLSHAASSNDVDSTIALGADRLLVAWSADDHGDQPNLSLRYTELELDGSALVPETALSTTSGGEPASANVWQPSVAPLPGGGFVVAGTRGIVGEPGGFRAFIQRIDAEGRPSGPTVDVPASADSQSSMSNPALAKDPAGDLMLAWSAEPASGAPTMQEALLESNGTFFGPTTAVVGAGAGYGQYPSAGFAPWAPRAFLAFEDDADSPSTILVKDAFAGGTAATLELQSPPGSLSTGPAVAVSKTGGAVAWFGENQTTGGRAILAQAFAFDGTSFTAGAQVTVSGTGRVAPDAPTLAHVDGDLWFVAWAQGTGSDLTMEGRFVELPQS